MALLDHILGALKDLQSPQNAGTMGLVQGLLASSGYTRLPTSFGQTLAMGLQGMQQAQSTAARNNLINAQAGFQQYRDDAFKNLLDPSQQQPGTPPAQSGIAPLPNLAGAIGGGNGYGAVPPVQGLLGNTQVFNQPQQAQAPAPGSAPSPVQQGLRNSLLYSMVGDPAAAKGIVDLATAKDIARQKAVGADPEQVGLQLGYLNQPEAKELGLLSAKKQAGALDYAAYGNNIMGVHLSNGQPFFLAGSKGLQMENGVVSPIPGYIPATAAIQQAQQQGRTAGTLVKGVTPAGAPTLVPGSTYLNSQAGGATGGVQPAGTAPAAPVGAPPTAAANSGPWNFNRWMPPSPVNIPKGQAGLSPAQGTTLEDQSALHVQMQKEIAEHANAAQETIYQVHNLMASLQNIPSGPGEEGKAEAVGAINAVLQTMNLPLLDLNLVNNAAEVGKWKTQVGFALSRQLGSREPGMITEQALKAVPNTDTPQQIGEALANGILAQAQYHIVKQQALLAYKAKFPKLQVPAYGFQTWFNQNYTPEMFEVLRAPPAQAQAIINSFTPREKENLKRLLLSGVIQ